jgi:hypothetical protein
VFCIIHERRSLFDDLMEQILQAGRIPTANYAVVLPKGMKLAEEDGVRFEPMSGDPRSEYAKPIGKEPDALKGDSLCPQSSGRLPRENEKMKGPSLRRATMLLRRKRPPLAVDPFQEYQWWIVSGIALLAAICRGLRPKQGHKGSGADSSAT